MVMPDSRHTPSRWNQQRALPCGTLVMLHRSKDEYGVTLPLSLRRGFILHDCAKPMNSPIYWN